MVEKLSGAKDKNLLGDTFETLGKLFIVGVIFTLVSGGIVALIIESTNN